jgi:hypothetical protein
MDYAVLKLPRAGYTMPRIRVDLGVAATMHIHVFGYIRHTSELNISAGEVSGLIPHGFTMTPLSAPGYSGAAIIADGHGRAVGYKGGNLDAGKKNNYQYCGKVSVNGFVLFHLSVGLNGLTLQHIILRMSCFDW